MGLYDKKWPAVFLDKGGAVYNVKHPDFGALGNGVANDRAAFVALEAFVDANLESLKSGYVPTGLYIISTSLTLSRAWEFAYGAKLRPSTGATITINGPFNAGLFQVFDLSAGGSVVFGAGTTPHISVAWFGALADSVLGVGTDNTVAIQAAVTCAQNSPIKVVKFEAGDYLTGDITVTGNGISLEGSGPAVQYSTVRAAATILTAKTGTNTVINALPNGGTFDDPQLVQVRNLHIDGFSRAVTGIKAGRVTTISGVSVRGCTTAGIWLGQLTNSARILDSACINNTFGLYVSGSGGTTTYSVERSYFNINAYGVYIQAGVLVHFSDCIIESNTTIGLFMSRPDVDQIAMVTFKNCWWEDNAGDTISMDAQTRTEANAPCNITFDTCRFNPSSNARKYMLLWCHKNVRFINCDFEGTNHTEALNIQATTWITGFEDCKFRVDPTAQFTHAWSTGAVGLYRADKEVRYAPTLINSWVNFGAGFPEAKYYHDFQGKVWLQGCIKTGTIGTVAFTLPPGFRPSTKRTFAVVSNGAFGIVEVQTDGDVVVVAGSNVSVDLDGICFPVTT